MNSSPLTKTYSEDRHCLVGWGPFLSPGRVGINPWVSPSSNVRVYSTKFIFKISLNFDVLK